MFVWLGEEGAFYFHETAVIVILSFKIWIIQIWNGLEFNFMLVIVEKGFAKQSIIVNNILEDYLTLQKRTHSQARMECHPQTLCQL